MLLPGVLPPVDPEAPVIEWLLKHSGLINSVLLTGAGVFSLWLYKYFFAPLSDRLLAEGQKRELAIKELTMALDGVRRSTDTVVTATEKMTDTLGDISETLGRHDERIKNLEDSDFRYHGRERRRRE